MVVYAFPETNAGCCMLPRTAPILGVEAVTSLLSSAVVTSRGGGVHPRCMHSQRLSMLCEERKRLKWRLGHLQLTVACSVLPRPQSPHKDIIGHFNLGPKHGVVVEHRASHRARCMGFLPLSLLPGTQLLISFTWYLLVDCMNSSGCTERITSPTDTGYWCSKSCP